MKPFLIGFKLGGLYRRAARRSPVTRLQAGIFCFLLVGMQGCAVQRIADGSFVQETKGYSFVLPGDDWEIDGDAWVYERDFGDVAVRKVEIRTVLRSDQNGSDPDDDAATEPRPRNNKRRLILDMDIGFQDKTHAMEILVGTISKGDMMKYLKGVFILTDSDMPENLIVGYMERLAFSYPSQQPVSVTAKNIAQAGTANRLQWDDGRNIRVIYGIALNREYLFITLLANRKTSESDFKAGVQALDLLVENIAKLNNN